MESISIGKLLASRRRDSLSPNQELIALGLANLAAAFSGGYPVTGGLSRSIVNYEAGARSTFASLFTALFIALTLLFFTPLLYFIPQATLAAIILIAIVDLFAWRAFGRVWRYSRHDGMALLLTFFTVTFFGVERGILVGMAVSILLFVGRTSQPHIAILGRLPHTDTYLNILRHPVQTWPTALLLRLDGRLYFANTQTMENTILNAVAKNPSLHYVILVGSAINEVDFTGLEMLEMVWQQLKVAGVELHFAAFKGPVIDQLKSADFYQRVGTDHWHLTTHEAVSKLGLLSTNPPQTEQSTYF